MGFNTNPTGRAAEFPNLKPLTTETARTAQKKSVESRMLNKEIREQFRRNAKAFQDVLDEIPDFSPLEVMKMCVHLALQDNNYEDAARWAEKLAEYKAPKMGRVDPPKDPTMKDLSDDDLKRIIKDEGLTG